VTLAGPEIALARERGSLVSISYAAFYEPARAAETYMQALWGQRQGRTAAADKVGAECCKRLMNCVVGKWAALGKAWKRVRPGPLLLPWQQAFIPYCPECRKAAAGPVKEGRMGCHRCGHNTILKRYRSIGKHRQRLDTSPNTKESCAALAGWTYSVGRVRLQGWIDQAGAEETYYVDSDSLLCSGAGYGNLERAGEVQPGVMGALRVQSVCESVRIGGIRDYSAGERNVQAGTRLDGAKLAAGRYFYPVVETVGEALSGGRRPEANVRIVSVPVHRAYRHGHIAADGRVEPINVGNVDQGDGKGDQ
jgi:hypothetical protein